MNINTVDLNLFLVFRAIYMTRSVTQAGDCLNLTQSTVSNALKRLRDRFNDPLFVRTPSSMVPTPMADELIGLIEQGLLKFTEAIDKAQCFAPHQSDRLFRIAINDGGQQIVMPGMLALTKRIAPSIRFETVDASNGEEARNLLIEGKIDATIGTWAPMGAGFHTRQLCDERFVALISRNHDIRSEKISLEDYLQAEHAAYRPSGTSDASLQAALSEKGILAQRKVVFTAAHAMGLATIVANSQLILTVQSRLAFSMMESRSDLRVIYLPFRMKPYPVYLQWHDRFNSDSGNRWLRELILQVFQNLPACAID